MTTTPLPVQPPGRGPGQRNAPCQLRPVYTDTDTAPLNPAELLAALAPDTHPRTDVEHRLAELHATLTRIVRDRSTDVVLGTSQPVDVAMLILGQPAIWSGIVRLDRIAARHHPRTWGPGSDTTVCSAGCGSWPCEEATILGLVPTPREEPRP